MPNGTPEQRSRIPWGDVSYRSFLLAAVVAAGGFALDNNATTTELAASMARIDSKLESHLLTHPNVGLSRRIDREQARIDDLEKRVRDLEIGRRTDMQRP